MKSPCLKGRKRHYFGSKRCAAGSLHPDRGTMGEPPRNTCVWCDKSREQVETEQKPYKAREKCARRGFGDFFNCIWAYRKNCPQWLQELCEKAYWEAYEE